MFSGQHSTYIHDYVYTALYPTALANMRLSAGAALLNEIEKETCILQLRRHTTIQ